MISACRPGSAVDARVPVSVTRAFGSVRSELRRSLSPVERAAVVAVHRGVDAVGRGSARPRRRPLRSSRPSARGRACETRDSTWSAPRSFDGGLPTPIRTRTNSSSCRCCLIERSPLCPARPPPTFTRSTAGGEVELVVHDHELVGLDAEAAHERRDRLTGVVHVGERDREREPLAADAHFVDCARGSLLLRSLPPWRRASSSTTSAPTLCCVRGVLVAGIAEPDHKQVGGPERPLLRRHERSRPRRGRRAAAAASPSAPSPSAALGRSPPRRHAAPRSARRARRLVLQHGDARRQREVARRRSWSPSSSAVTSCSISVGKSARLGLDGERVHELLEHAALRPHLRPRRARCTADLGLDRLVGAHAHEVDVDQRALHRVALDLAGDASSSVPSICSVISVLAPVRAERMLPSSRGDTVTETLSSPRP